MTFMRALPRLQAYFTLSDKIEIDSTGFKNAIGT